MSSASPRPLSPRQQKKFKKGKGRPEIEKLRPKSEATGASVPQRPLLQRRGGGRCHGGGQEVGGGLCRVAPGSSWGRTLLAARPGPGRRVHGRRRPSPPRPRGSAAQVGGQPQQQAAEQGGGARRGPGRAVAVQAAVVGGGVAAGLLAAEAGVAARAGAALVLQAGAAVLAEQLVVVAHVGCGAEGGAVNAGGGSFPRPPTWELLRLGCANPRGAA